MAYAKTVPKPHAGTPFEEVTREMTESEMDIMEREATKFDELEMKYDDETAAVAMIRAEYGL